jgi:predicted amidohydrolase
VVVPLDHHMAAPAICYESVQPGHADGAAGLGADVYLASAAKSARAVAAAFTHYRAVASRHRMSILFANAIGPSDDFISAGQSAAWDSGGNLVAQLDSERQGLLTYDLTTREAIVSYA